MKTVFKTYPDLILAWLKQTQEKGRMPMGISRDGSGMVCRLYFDGVKLYSYGPHYELARIVKENVILVNSKRSTVTTEEQKRYLSYGIAKTPNLKSFTVPSMYDHEKNISYYKDDINIDLLRASKARRWIRLNLNDAMRTIGDLEDYIKEFELPSDPDLNYWLKYQDQLLFKYNVIIV